METCICSKITWDTTNIKIKYKPPKNVNDIVLVFYERLPRDFWRIAIVTWLLPSRDSEVRGAIVGIAKINTIPKRPVKNSSQLKMHFLTLAKQIRQGNKSLEFDITNIKPLIRFNKTQEMFPSVTPVFSILLTTRATSASV